jgi:hypothetical protein
MLEACELQAREEVVQGSKRTEEVVKVKVESEKGKIIQSRN